MNFVDHSAFWMASNNTSLNQRQSLQATKLHYFHATTESTVLCRPVIACHLNTGQVRVSQPVSAIMQLFRKHSFPTTFQQVPDMSAIISVISVMNFQLQLLNCSVTLQLIHFSVTVNINNRTLIHRFYKFSSSHSCYIKRRFHPATVTGIRTLLTDTI